MTGQGATAGPARASTTVPATPAADPAVDRAVDRAAGPSLNRRVTVDSLWILAGYAVTSGAGFVFWIVAARLVPPAELGLNTAIYSIVTAAAAVAASGVGNALLVMLPVSGGARARLLRLGAGTGMCIATVTGLIAGVLVALFVAPQGPPVVTVLGVALVTVVWSLFVVKDPVLTALGHARYTLAVNGPVNVAKLGLLPLLVVVAGTSALPVVVASVAPAVLACLLVFGFSLPRLLRRTPDGAARPADRADQSRDEAATASGDGISPVSVSEPETVTETVPEAVPETPSGWLERNRRAFALFVLRDGTANGLYLGVILALPFLVTALAGAEQGAVFALCFQISLVLDLVVIGVGAALATHSAGAEVGAPAAAMRVWLQVLAVVTFGAVALIAVAPFLLGALGRFYEGSAGITVIVLLAAGSVLRTSFEIWSATLRARQHTTIVLICTALFAAGLVPLVLVLTPRFGAVGAAAALLVVTVGLGVAGVVGLLRPLLAGRRSAPAVPASVVPVPAVPMPAETMPAETGVRA
ncbi:hypothetical protein E3O44_15150 [Cryobacterium algoricola]|uniref:Membrane protein involved in the export of O-antigen and teichoic acid n=1 Tax=Cryobacterium algoricola TaxID=1259183 RepID=A0ABY2I8Z7_9MICO|nr:hypothetical protein [Cryobacterium algoricola]TFB84420.1 hypothetical protein E3O44_15150 [Cryobacterium algoricola]